MILGFVNKLYGYLAALGVVIATVAYAFVRGRSEGRAAANAQVQEHNQEVQEKFNEIDARRPDFDGAVGRLRDRAR